MPLLKVPQSSRLPIVRPFSLADIEAQSQAVLHQAGEQAQQIRADAHAAAHAEGLTRGMEDGRRTGHAEALEEHRQALGSALGVLRAAAAQMDVCRANLEADLLHDMVELALAIARRVAKRQAALDPQVLAANAQEALRMVVGAGGLRIAVHPSQRALLADMLPGLGLSWAQPADVELIEDVTVAPGGCRVFTMHGCIDADLETQLDRIAADLLPAAAEV